MKDITKAETKRRKNACASCPASKFVTAIDIHEVCEEGICMTCFQIGWTKCEKYEKEREDA